MKVLLSSIGTRGDVQPLIALALELRARGHNPSLLVAPNYRDWVESFGLGFIPIGPDLKKFMTAAPPGNPVELTEAQRQQSAAYAVRDQFRVMTEAARGYDLLVGGATLQLATHSVAEAYKIPYAWGGWCPAMLPSPDHPPVKANMHYSQSLSAQANLSLWMEDERDWDTRFGPTLNEERAKVGLAPISSVLRYIVTERPLLAADPALAPAGTATGGMQIVQTGAWFLPDQTALPAEVEQFLASGEPPIYFGFSSMREPQQTGQLFLEAARALGRRAIISQGWANVSPNDAGPDCLLVGDVNFDKLLGRVAAIVHHGGAGTTHAAARTGKPQVVVPHHYDQYYWAHRVQQSGVGVSGPQREELAVPALVSALRECLQPEMAARAQELASRVEPHGAQKAAEWLIREFG